MVSQDLLLLASPEHECPGYEQRLLKLATVASALWRFLYERVLGEPYCHP